MSEENLPKQELLLKLLNMTTSDNDNIACISIRKANDLLASAGWTWEKLLAGKIKVVADPFGPRADSPLDHYQSRAAAPVPPAPPRRPQAAQSFRATPSTPPRPRTTPPPPGPPPAPMPFTARAALGATTQISSRHNNYSNHCYCCGDVVASHDGFIFKPIEINPTAKNGWEVICKPCNLKVDATISNRRAPKWANVNPPTTANL